MFIDLHTHCLFGIDDGAPNIRTTLYMLEDAYEQGVDIVSLTPHCVLRDNDCIKKFINNRQDSYEILLKEIEDKKRTVPKLLLGAEVYLDNDISKFEGIKQLCIQGTNIMLIELPEGKISRRIVEWIYNLTLLDIYPLLAHIERYRISKEIFAELMDIDVGYQINANIFSTLLGRCKFRKIFKTIKHLCVSSDMHNNRNRSCNLFSAYALATLKFPDIADSIFKYNARKLLKEHTITE